MSDTTVTSSSASWSRSTWSRTWTGEGLQRGDGVELLPVEAAVDRRLEAPPDRTEEQGRGQDPHDDELALIEEGPRRQAHDEGTGAVEKAEHAGQGAVDHGAVHQPVDVPQVVPQDRDEQGDRDDGEHEPEHAERERGQVLAAEQLGR